ncbi:hypothetical protein PIB30_010103 [Stylosanthes scabra]|uniref:Uncharacterized protein n=1 Tax=Stylosanthes scabra TaxID=79078 RepID=A0ABU6Y220_9FABA|nr:hypothetical protein [Stylosanthes scabra]
MKRNVVAVVVCSVFVSIFGILSAALAFGAEITRVKISAVQMISSNSCIYNLDRNSPASGLALGALVALVIAQIILNVANGCWCCCCGKSPDAKRVYVVLCSTLSCVVKPGVFAAAAMFSLSSVATGIIYYVILRAGKNSGSPSGNSPYPNQSGIPTAQPQFA